MKIFLKISKTLFLFLIINYSLLITDLYSQQWQVYTTSNSQLPSNTTASVIIDSNNIKWIGTNNGMVRIEGNNWQIFDSTNTPLGTNGIYPTALDSFNNLWCVLTSKGIAKFDGLVWTIYNTINSGLPTNNVTSISIDYNDIKWLGTTLGVAKYNDTNWTIYNTSNSGLPSNLVTTITLEGQLKWIGTFSASGGMAVYNDTNWTIYNTGNSGLPANTIRNIRIDDFENKWVCTDVGGLAKFNSSLNLWTVYNTQNSGIPSNYPFCITFKSNYLKFIGTQENGVAIFNDTLWQYFNTNNSPLPNNEVNDIKIDKLSKVWIATLGGLAVYTPSPIGIINENSKLPTHFILHQNYPNPFNPSTNIKYQIINSEHVTLKVYNIIGKEVAVLINKKQNAGNYNINFNAINLPSGIYFYTLQTETFSQTKKMVLIK